MYSYEDRLTAVELREQGWKVTDIAEEIGVAEPTLYSWFRAARAGKLRPGQPGRRTEVTDEQAERICELWHAGLSHEAIAREVGFSDTTIRNVLIRLGARRGTVERDIILHLDVSAPGQRRDEELRQLLADIEYYALEVGRVPGNEDGRNRQPVKVRLTAWVSDDDRENT